MWIRSQDKMNLIEVQGFQVCYIKNEDEEYWEIYTIGTSLGTYKSKERAIEVLDEIEAFIENNYISIDDMPSHNNSPYPNYCPTHFTTTTRKKVFKMPKE